MPYIVRKVEFSFSLGTYIWVFMLPRYQKQIAKRQFGYILLVRWAVWSSLKEVPKQKIIKEWKKAINLNRHIHLGSSIKIPKEFQTQ